MRLPCKRPPGLSLERSIERGRASWNRVPGLHVFRVLHRASGDGGGGFGVGRVLAELRRSLIAQGFQLLSGQPLSLGEIQQVLLAGSFGSYLSPASAIKIGLVPKLSVLRIISAGNVASEGAKMTLLSAQERHGATALLDEIEYVELSDRADFNDKFVDRLAFPK